MPDVVSWSLQKLYCQHHQESQPTLTTTTTTNKQQSITKTTRTTSTKTTKTRAIGTRMEQHVQWDYMSEGTDHSHSSSSSRDGITLSPNEIATFFSHVKNNHYQQVVDLVNANPQYLRVRTNDEWRYTPLLWATQKGHTQLVQFFLEKGCRYNEKSEREFWIPILLACRYGFLDIVKMLHGRGQDLNEGKENDLWYPLHWAAYYNRIETGRFLLENGARIDLVTKDGSRPIHFAALQGHAEFIRLLIEFGEKPDVKQPSEWAYTPLMWCAQLGHFDCVKMLVEEYHVEINHKCGKIDRTAAGLAEMYNFPEIATYLKKEAQWREERPIREMVAGMKKVRAKRLWFDLDIICQE